MTSEINKDPCRPNGQRLLSLREIATYTGLSYWTVRSLVLTGQLPCIQFVGREGKPIRRHFVDRKDVDEFLALHKVRIR